jgi:hypothetical protein
LGLFGIGWPVMIMFSTQWSEQQGLQTMTQQYKSQNYPAEKKEFS